MIATDLYREGKALQDQADRLMAQVHAASNDVYNTNDKIRGVLDKARYVIDTIKNLPQNVSLPHFSVLYLQRGSGKELKVENLNRRIFHSQDSLPSSFD